MAYTPKQVIRSCLILMLIWGLPTAIFGMNSNLSKLSMILIIITLSTWSIVLLRNPIVNHNQFNLHISVLFQFLSILSLIIGFRELSHTTQMSQIEICMIMALYLLCIALSMFIIIKLIKKEHYRTPNKTKKYEGITTSIGVMGVLFGRKIFGNANQGTLSYVMGIFFIVVGFYLALGTTNFLRY